MYKSTGLWWQIWLSMHNTTAILVMLYAINSMMNSKWSDWVAWQCSVVTCSNQHWMKPFACVVVKFWTTREFKFDYFREICTRPSRFLACNLARVLFCFVFFFRFKICFCFFMRFVNFWHISHLSINTKCLNLYIRYADIKTIRPSQLAQQDCPR